jgi:hypothetical protein
VIALPAVRRLVRATLLAAILAAPALGQQAADANPSTAEAVQSLQQRMLADPQMAASIQALREDPAVQAILADPDIAAALARGDMAALLADPKIRRLADDPAVQNLTRQVGR